jgi:hypothetical protein
MTHDCTKAAVLRLLALLLVGGGAVESRADAAEPAFQVATFSAEVTPPLGHRLLTGGGKKATVVDDPLFAKGVVLLGADRPIMLCSVDWAEIRNDAYDRWRSVLAEAVGTEPVRVLVSCIHQHDTPLADLQAERILREQGSNGQIIDLEFHERAVQRVARAAK